MLLQALLNSVNKVVLLGVGEDAFGHFMQKTLFDLGVDTRAMEFDEFRTSTVLVSLQENGERDFTFLVAESADQF